MPLPSATESPCKLQAVGSPHTWPSLLAALAWLVELLTYDERAEASNEVRPSGRSSPLPRATSAPLRA